MTLSQKDKKKKMGWIISDKMDKTVVVKLERLKKHRLYSKKYCVSRNIMAHNIDNKYKIGDLVEIEEYKPVSKTKSWKVVKKIIK